MGHIKRKNFGRNDIGRSSSVTRDSIKSSSVGKSMNKVAPTLNWVRDFGIRPDIDDQMAEFCMKTAASYRTFAADKDFGWSESDKGDLMRAAARLTHFADAINGSYKSQINLDPYEDFGLSPSVDSDAAKFFQKIGTEYTDQANDKDFETSQFADKRMQLNLLLSGERLKQFAKIVE